jgi:hypothetical protein
VLNDSNDAQTLIRLWVYLPSMNKTQLNHAGSIIPEGFERHWLFSMGSNWQSAVKNNLDLYLDISPGDCAVAGEFP